MRSNVSSYTMLNKQDSRVTLSTARMGKPLVTDHLEDGFVNSHESFIEEQKSEDSEGDKNRFGEMQHKPEVKVSERRQRAINKLTLYQKGWHRMSQYITSPDRDAVKGSNQK